jgi:predicted transcriptional regulator
MKNKLEAMALARALEVGKRSRIQIYFDILRILCEELKNDKPSLTKVAHIANLPYDRFQKCLNKLIQLDIVREQNGTFFVTKKGFECINEYERINDFLKRMGLLP